MAVKNIFNFLNGHFPVNTACDFDNAGLLIGDGDIEVKKAVVSLDCTKGTIKTAVENDCQLIITHHPVIFSPIKNLLAGSIPFELAKNNIAVISMHTNLDMGKGGVNDCLCRALELGNITPVTAEDGFLLKSGEIPPISADSFAEKIKSALGGGVKYLDCGKEIKNVLVCSGSGGDFIETAASMGFDALVTSEIKHHQFLMAEDFGISVFDAGHFNTEDIVIDPLCNLLKKEFCDIEFIAYHKSGIKYK